MRAYHSASKEDAVRDNDGNEFPTAAQGLSHFIDLVLLPIIDHVAPRQVYAIWDGGNARRRVINANYKKRRSERVENKVEADEIKKYTSMLDDLFKAIGVRQVVHSGLEADDVIAYFCERMIGAKIVYTVDGDLSVLAARDDTQVVLKDTVIQDMHKNVPVALMTLYKSIVGDTSDEYIGVKGIGEQGFISMRDRYGWDGLAELESCVASGDYEALESAVAATSDQVLHKLSTHRQQWAESYQLALLHPEWCDLKRHMLQALTFRVPSRERLLHLLERTNLGAMMARFEAHLPTMSLITNANANQLDTVEAWAPHTPFLAFDYESYDSVKHPPFLQASSKFVDVLSQVPTGLSFCFGPNLQHAIYASCGHHDTDNLDATQLPGVLNRLQHISPLVAHNSQFEYTLTKVNFGLPLANIYDTRVTGSYADETAPQNLKQRALQDLRYEMTSYAETVGDRADMRALTADEVLQYGCDDSIATAHLFDLHTTVMQLEGCYDFFWVYERAPNIVLADTFIEGTDIDFPGLAKMADDDMVILKEGMTYIRELLAEHCAQPNEAGARQIFQEMWPIAEKRALDKSKSADEIAELKQKTWEKAWYGTAYVPYTIRKLETKFSPTFLQLTKVVTALGLEATEPPGKQPVVKTVSQWIVDNRETWESHEEGKRFIELLAAAAFALAKPKDRNGTEYDALHAFCVEVLERSGKENVEKHGDELNFDSPPQMAGLLYGKLALPVRVQNLVKKRSERDEAGIDGSASANARALRSALVYDCPEDSWQRDLVLRVIDVRKAKQNHKLYYTPYPLWPHPRDGRVHPSLTDCGTVTRRPTGSSPNILQVSKKDDAKIRQAFPAPEGSLYVALDFNGQELRLTASESGDPVMTQAYLSDPIRDIHSVTAVAIFNAVLNSRYPQIAPQFSGGINYEQFMAMRRDEQWAELCAVIRNIAKAVNFLMVYGGGYTTLAANLNIQAQVAQQIIDNAMNTYSRLRPWQGEVALFAKEHGYVETVYGSRRHADARLWSDDQSDIKRQERQMINFLAQGTAADILKVVMTQMLETDLILRFGATSIKPVYDEIAACVPYDNIVPYVQEMSGIMGLTPPGHPIPMMAECSIGRAWGSMQELADTRPETVEFALGEILKESA